LKTYKLDVPGLRALGIRMVVSEARCHYGAPLGYGDRVGVSAWFSEYSPLLKVSYDLGNLTSGRRSARAHTTLALTDSSGKLFAELPPSVRERLPR
jgi:acyl-CoA thioesterase FadM